MFSATWRIYTTSWIYAKNLVPNQIIYLRILHQFKVNHTFNVFSINDIQFLLFHISIYPIIMKIKNSYETSNSSNFFKLIFLSTNRMIKIFKPLSNIHLIKLQISKENSIKSQTSTNLKISNIRWKESQLDFVFSSITGGSTRLIIINTEGGEI